MEGYQCHNSRLSMEEFQCHNSGFTHGRVSASLFWIGYRRVSLSYKFELAMEKNNYRILD